MEINHESKVERRCEPGVTCRRRDLSFALLQSITHTRRSASVLPFSLLLQSLKSSLCHTTTMKWIISTSCLVLGASSAAAWVVVTTQSRQPVRLMASTSQHDEADPVTRIHQSSNAEHHLEEMQQVWQELQQKEKQVEVSHDKVRSFLCACEMT